MKTMRLINDDFRNVIKEIKKENICIVTDPPFNIGYKYNSYKDKMDEDEYFQMLSDLFEGVPFVMIHYPEDIYKLAVKMGKVPQKVVSWVYNSNTGKQHRDIAFFDIKPDFNKVRQPYKNPKDKRIQQRIKEGKTGAKLYDWWNINQVKNVSKEKTEHPCQMPLEVMKNIIGILPEDKIIVDPFMGSGTTGLACKEYDRDFIGVEMDKKYFEICKFRLEEDLWEEDL